MSDYDRDAVMTVPEVATYLKVAKSTVYRLAQAGELPGRKVGGAWRFSRQGVKEWLWERSPAGETSSSRSDGNVR